MTRGLLHRLATWLLTTISRTKWGLSAALMPVIVDRLGPLGAIRWMAKNLPTYEKMLKVMGPMRGHLVCVFVSMLNGCYYCAFAHARAFQLHFFQVRDALFPLDEHQMVDLIVLPDAEVLQRLEGAFGAAQMPEETRVYSRLVAMKLHGEAPATPEDAYLAHVIQMFEVLNFCGISVAVPLDGAHDSLNKDGTLKRRYAEARLADEERRSSRQAPAGSPAAASR